MSAKMSVSIIFVKVIIYLLLYSLHGCTFKTFSKQLGDKNSTLIINAFRKMS